MLQPLAQLLVALAQPPHLGGQLGGAGKLVQQALLLGFLQQGLVGVLTVDIDQHVAQGLQVGQRGGAAVDIAPGAALLGDDPAQQAFVTFQQVVVFQPLAGLGGVADIEAGVDVGAFGAVADYIAVGAIAQGQAQGIQHDGFAGAGLAGNHGHAAVQFHFQMGGDSDVVDTEVD